jgi:hypothetical protein
MSEPAESLRMDSAGSLNYRLMKGIHNVDLLSNSRRLLSRRMGSGARVRAAGNRKRAMRASPVHSGPCENGRIRTGMEREVTGG